MPTLHWLTRDDDIKAANRVPYRLLEADPALSAGDPASGNMLIQGDNLEALKSLLPYYAGQVKCIYIDPPYNTRSAFEHYDDNLEHSQWLAMIWPRLELLRELLAEEGSIWVSIDDNEGHYLKVVMDEVFGRRNFIIDVIWQKRDGPPNDRTIAAIHEHVQVWGGSRKSGESRTRAEDNFNLMPRSEKANAQYRVFDEPDGPDIRGPFRKIDTTANGKGGRSVQSLIYGITNPYTGQEVWPREGTCWRHNREEMTRLQNEKRLYWGVKGTATTPMRKLFASEAKQGMTTPSLWSELAYNQHASREIELLFGNKASFETPKPEALLQRILHIATNPGDLVLDSFLGSGTTAAVAHKMGRRYIGIEMGDHAVTHCAPRLGKVIAGEQGGISQAVNWQGGGGFTFYRLGEAVFDEDGRIRAGIGFASLAAHVWFSETGVALGIRGGAAEGTRGEQDDTAEASDESMERADARTHPQPLPFREGSGTGPFLGVHDGRGYALLYNGVLGDRRPQGGNVLTNATLALIRESGGGFGGPITVYGEASRLSEARLRAEGVTFKQTPYDVRAR